MNPPLIDRLRPFIWPVVIVVIAAALYTGRVRREMVDFAVYRTAATRALAAEPLYRESDGHYQFKYLPAFAMAMAPFAKLDLDSAKAVWFAMSVGLLTAYVRWSVRALPERRRSGHVLIWLSVLLMAKFYAHELLLGQTNVLLGVLLVAALLAAQIDLPLVAGALIGCAAFVKPVRAAAPAVARVRLRYRRRVDGSGRRRRRLWLPALRYGWLGNLTLLGDWYRTVSRRRRRICSARTTSRLPRCGRNGLASAAPRLRSRRWPPAPRFRSSALSGFAGATSRRPSISSSRF